MPILRGVIRAFEKIQREFVIPTRGIKKFPMNFTKFYNAYGFKNFMMIAFTNGN